MSGYDGAIIGYVPDLPEDLIVPEGEQVDDLHVTLLYLTDDHTELDAAQRATIGQVMSGYRQIIEGTVTGAQTLGDSDPQAVVLMLDMPELQAIRSSMRADLLGAGIPLPDDRFPEYLPHLTVGYGTDLAAAESMVGKRITLGTLAAFYGGDRQNVALNQRKDTTMADTWTAVIGQLGIPTGDGRVIFPGGFTTRALPLPLMWQEHSDEGHDKAVTVGAIESITPDLMTGNVMASGTFLDPKIIPEVGKAMELVRAGVVGPSMDPGAVEVDWVMTGGGEGTYGPDGYTEPEPYNEICVFTKYECAGATLVSVPAFSGVWITLGSTAPDVVTAAVRSSGWGSMPVADAGTSWDGSGAAKRVATWAGVDKDGAGAAAWAKYAKAFLYKDDSVDAQTKGAYKLGVADVIGGRLEIVPKAVYAVAGVLNGARGGADIPEAQQTKLKGVVSTLYGHISKALDDDSIESPFSLVACAQDRPPAAWFRDPQLTGPTPITVTADGQIFGHIGLHGQAHRGMAGNVGIPKSMSGYREFLLGGTLTAEGDLIPTGKITLGGGHAGGSLGMEAAVEHYDDVSTTVANVVAGDDEFGVWVAGAIRAGVTDVQIDELMQSPPSGDWRQDQLGNLELIGVHAVNVPGFAVYRVNADLQSGDVYALVASARFTAAPTVPEVPVEQASGGFAFDPQGATLREQLASAGVGWPAITAEIGGVEYGPYDVAEGCVMGMLGITPAPVVASVEVVSNERERARARARLQMLLGRPKVGA